MALASLFPASVKPMLVMAATPKVVVPAKVTFVTVRCPVCRNYFRTELGHAVKVGDRSVNCCSTCFESGRAIDWLTPLLASNEPVEMERKTPANGKARSAARKAAKSEADRRLRNAMRGASGQQGSPKGGTSKKARAKARKS
jgi:hypothetical protein